MSKTIAAGDRQAIPEARLVAAVSAAEAGSDMQSVGFQTKASPDNFREAVCEISKE